MSYAYTQGASYVHAEGAIDLAGGHAETLQDSINSLLSETGSSQDLENLAEIINQELSGVVAGPGGIVDQDTGFDNDTWNLLMDILFDIDDNTKALLLEQYNLTSEYDQVQVGDTYRKTEEQVAGFNEITKYDSVASNLILKRDNGVTYIVFKPGATQRDVDTTKNFLNSMFSGFAIDAEQDNTGAFRLQVGQSYAWTDQNEEKQGQRTGSGQTYKAANLLNSFMAEFDDGNGGTDLSQGSYNILALMGADTLITKSLDEVDAVLANAIEAADQLSLSLLTTGVATIQLNESVLAMTKGIIKSIVTAIKDNSQTLKSG